jgi:hypothetical protein
MAPDLWRNANHFKDRRAPARALPSRGLRNPADKPAGPLAALPTNPAALFPMPAALRPTNA